MGTLKDRVSKYGILGGIFVGLGGLGVFGVCHSICQVLIIVLAAVGISLVGMPLAFLTEPWFIITSFALGFLFIGAAVFVYFRHRKMVGEGG